MAVLIAIAPRVLRAWVLIALAALASPLVCAVSAAEVPVDEYHVKAAFLFNFAKFVAWSDTPTREAIVIGIVGEDPFGDVLDAAVRGKSIGGRLIEVRRLSEGEDLHGCHILFVGASEKRRFADLVRRAGSGVLTVGEVPQFVREGGVIRFFLDGNRVRFQINQEAASLSGLRIHSQLMSLAAK